MMMAAGQRQMCSLMAIQIIAKKECQCQFQIKFIFAFCDVVVIDAVVIAAVVVIDVVVIAAVVKTIKLFL